MSDRVYVLMRKRVDSWEGDEACVVGVWSSYRKARAEEIRLSQVSREPVEFYLEEHLVV